MMRAPARPISFAGLAYFFRRLAAASGLWTARCYAVDNDPVSGASILLFEDLATLGLRQGDRGSGIRGSEAETVVTQLAVFQARFWGARQPQAHREILSLTQNVATAGDDAIRDYYREAWPVVEACGLYDLSPEVIGYGRGLLADPNRARRRLAEASQTLLHGDAHVENLFFDDRPASPAFALIDWEDLAVGHGLLDIAWLVTTSVHTRDAGWEPDLVRAYFDALLAAGVQDYRWEACQADYAWALASVFVQGVLNCSVEANLSAAELALEPRPSSRSSASWASGSWLRANGRGCGSWRDRPTPTWPSVTPPRAGQSYPAANRSQDSSTKANGRRP